MEPRILKQRRLRIGGEDGREDYTAALVGGVRAEERRDLRGRGYTPGDGPLEFEVLGR